MHRGIDRALILALPLVVATPLPAQFRQAAETPPASPVFQFNPQLGTGAASVPEAGNGLAGVGGRDGIGVPNYLDGGRLDNTQASFASAAGSGQTSSSGQDRRTGGTAGWVMGWSGACSVLQ